MFYNVVYVIPLLLIVSIFAWTMGAKKLSEKEGRRLKLLSGLMMLGLGIMLMIAPEGTRGVTSHWKSGFYWIAHTAQVPIVMAYMDYERKLSGLGPVFRPTGDVEADMREIKAYYAQFKGKNWRQFDHE